MQHIRRDGRGDDRCEETVTVLKKIAVPITYVVALVCCADDEVHDWSVFEKPTRRRAVNRVGVFHALISTSWISACWRCNGS